MNEDKLILYNSDGTPFHGIYLTTFSFTDNVMAETFLSGSFKYDGTLLDSEFDKTQYTIYKQNKYYIFDAPTVSMKYDDGFVKYDVKFIPEKDLLKNIPFTDEVTEGTENKYFTSGRDVKFFGDIREFIGRLNAVLLKNAPAEGNNTQWTVELQADLKTEAFEINLSNVFVTDALKTMYETYNVPYYIENRKILIGKPNFKVSKVFEYGQNRGLCGLTKTPKNNKVVTRITGHGSENNIPFRYPIIRRKNGEVVEHSYTRPYLMPSIYVDCVNKKVNPDAEGYDPNIRIIDYYDAIGEDYVTQINNEFPSFQIQDFPEIQPTIQDIKYPLNEDGTDKPNTKFIDELLGVEFDADDNNNIDPETGDVEHPYFNINLNPMGFDLYGSVIEYGEMTFAIKSGSCAGCQFKAAVDYDLWKKNFYVKEGDKLIFTPGTPEKPAKQRDLTRFPYSNYESIKIRVYKDLDTFGVLLPINPYIVPKNGDKFVILHIDLPQKYIDEAQDKLDKSLKQFMKENNFDKYSFSSDFDEKILIENQSILDQFKTNSLVDIKYNDNIIELSTTQLSISYDENKPLPSFKFTLSDEIQINYNSIQQVVKDLEDTDFIVQQNQIKGAKEAANFYKGLKTVENGLFDADGKNRIGVVESLLVKTNALFIGNDSGNFSLQNGFVHLNINGDPNQVNIDAGTLTHFSVSRVTEYNINEAFWNIDSLSLTNLDDGILYYVYIACNRTNNSARFVLDSTQILWNSDAYAYYFLWGQLVPMGSANSRARSAISVRKGYKTYGLSSLMGGFFTGQVLSSPNYSYENKSGMEIDMLNATIRALGGANIEGKLTISQGSSGATNLEEWKQVEDIKNYTDNILPNELSYLQNQIDGVIDSWFFSYTPTLLNKPASDWTTIEEKRRHIGDTFTNTQSFIDNSITPDAGKSWRFLENNGTFNWEQIADSDAVKALLEAAKAQDTADQKRRTFIVEPITPYDKGDLWVQGDNGDIMRCIKSRLSGTFVTSDWNKASKYTDDTAANQAMEAAHNAQGSADNANTAVGNLNTYVDGAFADGVITETEAKSIATYLKTIRGYELDINQTFSVIYDNPLLLGVAKADLLESNNDVIEAINNLRKSINNAIVDGKTYPDESADVDAKFIIFNDKYSDYIRAIEKANTFIQNEIKLQADKGVDIAGVAKNLADEAKAKTDNFTSIEGGLIMSTILELGEWRDGIFNMQAGVSGLGNLPTDIMAWFGGKRFDYGNDKSQIVFRRDGSGYLAGGNIYWDKLGNVSSTFNTIFIGEQDIKEFVNDIQDAIKIETVDGKKRIRFNYDSYSLGALSSYGIGTGGGGGTGVDLVDNLTSSRVDAALTANQGRILKSLIDGKASDWNSITGKPLTFTPSAHTHLKANITDFAHTHIWGDITGKPSIFPTNWANIADKPNFDATYLKLTGGTLTGNLTGKNMTANGYLYTTLNGKTTKIGSQTDSYCHYETDAISGHWFNKQVKIDGDVYAGTGYNRRLAYVDEIDSIANVMINVGSSYPGQYNLNTLPIGRAYNYTSDIVWLNGPVGMGYGIVYNMGGGVSYGSSLSLQLAADINHNVTNSTNQLWFRMSNNLGFQNDWKKFWHSGNSNLSTIDWASKDFRITGWIYASGEGGWYNSMYGGGIHMKDATYLRVYGSKKFLVDNGANDSIYTTGGIRTGECYYGHNNVYASIISGGNEICITGASSMIVNYRAPSTAPQTWYWRNGTSTGWSHHYFGNITANGNILATGEITAYSASDKRLKDNLKILDGLKYLRKLESYEFNWNNKAREVTKSDRMHGYGYIAQDVQKILPDFVNNIYESDYLGIQYEKFIPLHGAAILQLDKKQSEHERRIKALEKNNKELKDTIKKLSL